MSTRRAKKPGTINKPSGVINTKRELIVVNGKTMVLTQFETPRAFTIYIGGDDIYCIDAQVTRDLTGKFNPEGYLTKVRWDMDCSLDKDFKEGKDTQMITQLALTYIKKSFPDVKEISFSDLSERRCDNGASVSLSAMKYITDGQTWYLPDPLDHEGMQSTGEYSFASGLYESHFNASIHPDSEYSYQQMSTYANEKKKTTTWNEFYERFLTHVKSPIRIEDLEIIYTSSNTFQEFFSEVSRRIGIADFCTWLSTHSWFNTNFLKFVRFNTFRLTFRMNISLFNESYTTEVMTGGWRGKTRKQK